MGCGETGDVAFSLLDDGREVGAGGGGGGERGGIPRGWSVFRLSLPPPAPAVVVAGAGVDISSSDSDPSVGVLSI